MMNARVATAVLMFGAVGGVHAGGIATLYESYLRYEFAGRVADTGATLCEGLQPADAAAVREALDGWKSAQTHRVKQDLGREFGDAAQERFGGFVEILLDAEKKGDALYLGAVGRSFGFAQAPADYAALRQAVMSGPMAEDMQASAFILGSLQSWTQWKREGRPTPPLTAWLTRSKTGHAAPAAAPKPKAPRPPPDSVSALAAAEAAPQMTLPEEGAEESLSPLAAYSDLVKQKRDQMFKDATEASEQLLAQRKEWEEDVAAKKTAAAEADAEAVKKHAEALAQADKDALEQQQNSWKNKLKGVASALVSSTVGAFTGGVGTQAGEKLAEAVFKKD